VCTRSGSHANNLSLVAALIAHNGEARTEEWAKGVFTGADQDDPCQPVGDKSGQPRCQAMPPDVAVPRGKTEPQHGGGGQRGECHGGRCGGDERGTVTHCGVLRCDPQPSSRCTGHD